MWFLILYNVVCQCGKSTPFKQTVFATEKETMVLYNDVWKKTKQNKPKKIKKKKKTCCSAKDWAKNRLHSNTMWKSLFT